MNWTVLIPAKALPAAKSRLAGAPADPQSHADLVRAIRSDTLAAVLGCPQVARVVLVVDRPAPDWPVGDPRVELFLQPVPGLNSGLRDAAELAATQWPGDGIAAVVADLPALRPAELSRALRAAEREAGFVPDADGTGTTLLAAPAGHPMQPRFGADSARRHTDGAARLPGGPGLRQDVDTPADLARAIGIGVGPATARVTGARVAGEVDEQATDPDARCCVHLDSA